MTGLKIAIVGSGISGLSAAWLLSKNHQVTLYEQGQTFGGHANTLDIDTPDGPVAMDAGFIVYNEKNYPNLVALFDRLGVETEFSDMTFALSIDGGRYEYSGTGANGFFGQRRNLFWLPHWKMLADISRFFKDAKSRLDQYEPQVALGDFLMAEGYSQQFITEHIIPMGAAIWSTSMREMLNYPARTFVNFYSNHDLMSFTDRSVWRTVSGGSRNYVQKLLANAGVELKAGNAIQKVVRHPGYVHIVEESGAERPFDQVVIATHADQALKLLDHPTFMEQQLLSRFPYQENRAIVHRDPKFMPKRRRLWSSWNYLKSGIGFDQNLCVTYWMNNLQNLPTRTDLFLTLNPPEEIAPEMVEREIIYDHPVFDAAAVDAQRDLWSLQGENHTWFCGAYFGHGFHEDGAESGLAVAEALGGMNRPWSTEGRVSRLPSRANLPHVAAAE